MYHDFLGREIEDSEMDAMQEDAREDAKEQAREQGKAFALAFCQGMNALLSLGAVVLHVGTKDDTGLELQVYRFKYTGETDEHFISVFYSPEHHKAGYYSAFSKLGPQNFRVTYPAMETPILSCEMCHEKRAEYQIDHVIAPDVYGSIRACPECTDYVKDHMYLYALVLPLDETVFTSMTRDERVDMWKREELPGKRGLALKKRAHEELHREMGENFPCDCGL